MKSTAGLGEIVGEGLNLAGLRAGQFEEGLGAGLRAHPLDRAAAEALQRDGRFVAGRRRHAQRPELKVFNAIPNQRCTGVGLLQRQGRR